MHEIYRYECLFSKILWGKVYRFPYWKEHLYTSKKYRRPSTHPIPITCLFKTPGSAPSDNKQIYWKTAPYQFKYACFLSNLHKTSRKFLDTIPKFTKKAATTKLLITVTSISANADRPRNATSRKINHTGLPTNYNYGTRQWVLVESKLLHRPRNVGYYQIFEW